MGRGLIPSILCPAPTLCLKCNMTVPELRPGQMSWNGRKAIHCLRPQASYVSFARSKLPMCPWMACACLLQKVFLSERGLETVTLILHKKSSLGTTCRPGCHQHPPGGEGMWAGPPVSSVCAPKGLELSRHSVSSPAPIQKRNRWAALICVLPICSLQHLSTKGHNR